MSSPEDKTPDFDEVHGREDAAPQEPLDEQLGPEPDLPDFGGPDAAEAAPAPSDQTDAAPDFSFAAADTPAEPLDPHTGLGEPGEEPSAEQAPDEAGEQAQAEPESPEGLPEFLAEAPEAEQRPEAEGEEKEAEEGAEEEKEPKESLLAKLARANPYTVLLGIALAALTLGVLLLLLELKAYNFDWKAEGAPGRAALPALYDSPPSTTAAACPDWVQLSDNA